MNALSVLAVIILSGSAPASSSTTITITDQVLVKDCIRLGINLGGDAYYSGAALVKKRASVNFEGTSYRQCHFGPVQDEHGTTTWFGVPDVWRKILIGGQYTILSGPARGTTGKIVDIRTKRALHNKKMEDFSYFVFDRVVQAGPPNGGLLVERMALNEGQMRPRDGYWNSKQNRLVIGDVPPNSLGHAAAVLDGTPSPAHLRLSTHYQRYGETNGTWIVSFWAKAGSGTPRLEVRADRNYGESKSIAPTTQWKKYELTLNVDKVPEPKSAKDNPHLLFVLEADQGEVLVDDIELWMQGDTNPTVFRDDCVRALKLYHPGVVRCLQMGGNTLDNCLQPPLREYAFASQKTIKPGPYAPRSRKPYSLHEMYVLCEMIGAEPWYCLPGTLSMQEMRQFMEYLGAPADQGYGRVRARLGHPEPWTDVFDHIHVEFGNEAWNNAGPYQVGGFNGKDYWNDLIATGKGSPYYKTRIVFHAAGQGANSWLNRRIIQDVPNADRFAVAPYIIQSLSSRQAEEMNTDAKLFRWAFAWPILRATDPGGAMYQNYELAKAAAQELSVYEINHHITHGDGPLEPRNRITTSLGGGLNVCGTMLQMLKDYGCRTQCLFSLIQHSYNAHNIGPVRLWGTVLSMRAGHERYRPTFLACALANRVIGGNLVATRHDGANPTFTATGVFNKRNGEQTLEDLPCLLSLAFADGARRGLIVINRDVSRSHAVAIRFDAVATGAAARLWLLSADKITANNEFEQPEPQVKLVSRTLTAFRSGYELTVPPFSMVGLSWQVNE